MLQRSSNEKGNCTHFPPRPNIGTVLVNVTKLSCQSFSCYFPLANSIMYPTFFWSSVYMSDTLPNALHMLSHLILPATPLRMQLFPYFTD